MLIESQISADGESLGVYARETDVPASNSDGYATDAPLRDVANSHDVFTSDVFVMDFDIGGRSLQNRGSHVHNINADMSYVPAYPGVDGPVAVTRTPELSAMPYLPFELMGTSEDVDALADGVNPTPDPYFSVDSISENDTFGRVYEDYSPDYDKTLLMIGNPPLNNNLPSQSGSLSSSGRYDEAGNFFEWTVDLGGCFTKAPYTDDDYARLNVVVFNRNCLGKNPYFVCDLSSAENRTIDAFYGEERDGFEV